MSGRWPALTSSTRSPRVCSQGSRKGNRRSRRRTGLLPDSRKTASEGRCRSLEMRQLCQAEGVANFFMKLQPNAVRLGQKNFHNGRIKLGSGIPLNLLASGGDGQGLTVRAVGNHCVERIGNREN